MWQGLHGKINGIWTREGGEGGGGEKEEGEQLTDRIKHWAPKVIGSLSIKTWDLYPLPLDLGYVMLDQQDEVEVTL